MVIVIAVVVVVVEVDVVVVIVGVVVVVVVVAVVVVVVVVIVGALVGASVWASVGASIGVSVGASEDPVNNTGGTIPAMAIIAMAKMLNPITFDFLDIPTMINIAIELNITILLDRFFYHIYLTMSLKR